MKLLEERIEHLQNILERVSFTPIVAHPGLELLGRHSTHTHHTHTTHTHHTHTHTSLSHLRPLAGKKTGGYVGHWDERRNNVSWRETDVGDT